MFDKYQEAMMDAVSRVGDKNETVAFRSSAVGVVGISRRKSVEEDESGRGLDARLHGWASTISDLD